MSGWTSPSVSMTPRRRVVYAVIIIAAFLVGADHDRPGPGAPQPEGRPDVTGSADVPEVSPIGPS